MKKYLIHILCFLILSIGSLSADIVEDSLHSHSLKNNLAGENPTRKVLVYLPPDYETTEKEKLPGHLFNAFL